MRRLTIVVRFLLVVVVLGRLGVRRGQPQPGWRRRKRDFFVVLRCGAAPLNRVYEVITTRGGAIQQFSMMTPIDADEPIVATTTGAAFSGRYVFTGGKKRLAEYCVTPTLRAPIVIVGASP